MEVKFEAASAHVVGIGKEKAIEVDLVRFNPDVLHHVFAYGLKQILNDAGSAATSPDDKLAMATKKLESLYAGALRTVRAAKPGLSPRDNLIYKYARADIAAVLKAGGRKIAEEPEEKIEAAIAKIIAKNEASYGKRADAELAAKIGATVDLADLGL